MEAAFFDLDKTVIAKASLVAFGRPLYDAGMISRLVIARALWSNFLFQRMGAGEERMRKFRHSALRITRGWDQALVSAIVRETLVEVIEPIVYAEALDLIQEHQRAGRRVFLVSASPEEIVAPLAQFLGVDEAIASRAELDEEGRYTGEVEFWSYGPYKAEAILTAAERYGIELDRSYAYSDSATDLPMLETVGVPVAVNPDRELARVARDRGWETRWFEHPVALRERVNMPRPGRAVAVAGSALAVVAAGVVVWWWVEQRRHRLPAAAATSGVSRRVPMGPPVSGRARVIAVLERTPLRPSPPPAPPAGVGQWYRRARPMAHAPGWFPSGAARNGRAAERSTRPAASSPRMRRGRAERRSR